MTKSQPPAASKLDPLRDSFDAQLWFENVQRLKENTSGQSSKRLSVSFSRLSVFGSLGLQNCQHTTRVQILHDFEGVVRSGEMLLVLGRPGSGCSTLLKSLAGDRNGINVDAQASLNYHGITSDQMRRLFPGEMIYTAEEDVHFPELSVDQTLSFAARAKTALSPQVGKSVLEWSEHLKAALITLFNLERASSVLIGNHVIRGVSGGERKRVSIAEAILSWAPFQLWDNSTRGLDSSTALSFVRVLRYYATSSGGCIIMSIYQASQAIFDTFDKVILLYEGRQIFFGTTNNAKTYFEELGFKCPKHVSTADFLTAITHPAEARLLATPDTPSSLLRSPTQFAEHWERSSSRTKLLQDLQTYEHDYPIGSGCATFTRKIHAGKASKISNSSPYTISLLSQILLCIRRAFQRLSRNISPALSGTFGNVVMAVIVGSVFLGQDSTTASLDNRSVLIFFAVLLNAFMSAFEVLTIWAQRPIVEKQNRYRFYHPFVEAAAAMICDIPNKVFTSVCFNLALYFMTNLRRTPEAFFIWFLFSFTCFITMSMFFRMVGSSSRTIEQTMAPVAIFILNYIIYAGFIIPVGLMHPWLSWIAYINPLSYTYEALMINEFSERRFDCARFVPYGPSYEGLSPLDRVCATNGAVPGQNWIDGDSFLALNYDFRASHLWRNLGIIIAMGFVFCVAHLFTSEKILAQRSKGEVLLFKKRNQVYKSRGADEERPAMLRLPVATSHGRVNPSSEETTGPTFVWKDLCYEVHHRNTTKKIINGVDGFIRSGCLTALMGATGAGKTTLLNVLANRVSPSDVRGDILVNGSPRSTSTQRKIGYVQQDDVHQPTSTVREALVFSAMLRQSAITPQAEKMEYVDYIVHILEMEAFQHAVIGVPGQGLNIEQRKRLSIGVEMVAKPELLLFLDEPTSGLDSQSAWSICQLLRKLAHEGQSIMCTVHQPSAQILQQFDQILLLVAGGETAYFGEVARMTSYFERHGALSCGSDQNPAEWVVDIIGSTVKNLDSPNWAQIWKKSAEYSDTRRFLDTISAQPGGADTEFRTETQQRLQDQSEYASPFKTQLYYVLMRTFQEYWRSPVYIWSRFVLCVGTAFFIGFSFWESPSSIQGLRNSMFSTFLFFMSFSQVIQQIMPHFVESRALFEAREGPSKTYSWTTFILSQIIVEIPWQTLMSVGAFVVWYFPIGFQNGIEDAAEQHERAGIVMLFVWVFYLFTSTFAILVIAAVEHAEMGVNLAQLFFYLILIFCGVLVPFGDLPSFWKFMYRVSPLTYLVSGIYSSSMAFKPVKCSEIEVLQIPNPSNQECSDYLSPFIKTYGGYLISNDSRGYAYYQLADTNSFLQALEMDYASQWSNFGLLWGYLAFNIIATFAIYRLRGHYISGPYKPIPTQTLSKSKRRE
ncbi:putative ABC multidrug transporter [Pseudovirgaria hyperparasitica]|uniref:Putative ABC multidrug transporter n=1 Tax=Pseudovirgaria hyperparasitica TaxID=470096 RepID=A0A6A6WA32_9PEZI|nr:putative ABC multidrug transporter [Pseudovirgaria hyperparasitica]KAF2759425.1 putative ABC multidrug transporter [Pseudovirgaria hyperparasitica]